MGKQSRESKKDSKFGKKMSHTGNRKQKRFKIW